MPQKALAAGNDFLSEIEQQKDVPEGYIGIYTQEDLRGIETVPDGNYILMKDIVLEGDWTPLCGDGKGFAGVLDGNGYSIRGLHISTEVHRGGNYAIGLFAKANGAKIHHLMLEGQISVQKGPKDGLSKGSCYVGGLIGQATGGIRIKNCITNVGITIEEPEEGVFEYEGFAGLVGAHTGGGGAARIDFCRNLGNITGNSPHMAGVIYGFSAGAILSITYCVNEGTVEGDYNLGGVVGQIGGESYVIGCINKGSVTGDYNLAGIIYDVSSFTELTDCLNMGTITVRNDGASGAGIAVINDSRNLERCINVGTLVNQDYGSIAVVSSERPKDCYYLTGTLYGNEGGRYPADSTDVTGLVTMEQMGQYETFHNFDFAKKWTMDPKLGHPYITCLMAEEIENVYKVRYVENMLALTENAKYSELMTGSGDGSMAGMLGEAYKKAGMMALGNELWDELNTLNDLFQWNVDIENEFDVIILELMRGSLSEDIYGEQVNGEVLEAISDFATYFTETMEVTGNEEIQQLLKSMADTKDIYGDEFSKIFSKMMSLLNDHADGLKTANDVIGKLGGVVSSADALAAGCFDMADCLNYYALCTAYVEANKSYADVLRDTVTACQAMEDWHLIADDLDRAVVGFEKMVEDAANDSAETLYWACVKEAGEAALGVAGNLSPTMGNLWSKHPTLASVKAGVGIGTLLGNGVTSMDDVASYAKMMYMIGFLSQGMHQVVIDREVAFENHTGYEEAEALSEAIDMYLNVQILACDYAIGYFNALCTSEMAKVLDWNEKDGKAPWFLKEEQEMLGLLKVEKNRLMELKESGQSVYVGLDGTIGGFVIACPVTVVVETKKGEELARMESGMLTVSPEADGNYILLGAEGEKKAGFFDPDKHVLRIIGEEDGTMDVMIYYSEDGQITESYDWKGMEVEKGKTYTWDGETLTTKGSNGMGVIFVGVALVIVLGGGMMLLKGRKKSR